MTQTGTERFQQHVLSRYRIYNSIFMTLPFDTITRTGVLLPLFQEMCEEGYRQQQDPTGIVEAFFERYGDSATEADRIGLLFRFIQYIERQVVLFDAVEDAAFTIVNHTDGRGTLRSSKEEADERNKRTELKAYLEEFRIRPVLTAHPTQFYPGPVLGIITDLAKAIEADDLALITELLAQLGKTPFFNKRKPTPYDEAVSLIWYLENVFYQAAGAIYNFIQGNIREGDPADNEVIQLGFWPGGDRDGNPFVTTETTLQVADRLRTTILRNYHRDVRALRRRLTFTGVDVLVQELEAELHAELAGSGAARGLDAEEIERRLVAIRDVLVQRHESLFLDLVVDLIHKVHIFGLHFATLDIRQDSRVHASGLAAIAEARPALFPAPYAQLDEAQKTGILSTLTGDVDPDTIADEMARRTLESVRAMQTIQQRNGEQGCNRYIISHCGRAVDVLEAFAMIRLCDWPQPTVDVIPLFETIDDLRVADAVMASLYANPEYAAHLARRGGRQTVMLGFSDGTKDGGYLMANWSIYTAKERLTAISRRFGIKVIFFDGRGGPPARGGGKTHQFYASLGPTIEHREVQLTVQGQTISSHYGTPESCRYNLEQLLSSGIANAVFADADSTIAPEDRVTMDRLATLSHRAYADFKAHPSFLPYLEQMSTLNYYARTNIGSRPAQRGGGGKLVFADLRAIPFVGSWSQLKQNVPGFYGVGTAIAALKEAGDFDRVKALYANSAFFRALLENSMMSLAKSFFPLTAYMKDDAEFGAFWTLIFEEHERTKAALLELAESSDLMEDARVKRASIAARERIVLPLLTIQQHALREIRRRRAAGAGETELDVWEKMVTRSMFGNINASRNSA